MKKYLVTYHAPASYQEVANATPEDMQKGMEAWMKWGERVGDALVDWGSPVLGGQRLSKDSRAASSRAVVGYSIIQAEDMDKAVALMEGHPHIDWAAGCEIEVHESMPMHT